MNLGINTDNHLLFLFILIPYLLLLSCNSDFQNTITDNVCGCEQPQKELPWLKELIKKAETDKTGNYWGTIWLLNYKGKDIFVTNMMLGSGYANFFFDCSGNHLVWRKGEDYCPSDFVGKGHFYIEDEEDFERFFHLFIIFIYLFFNILQNTKKWVKFHLHALGDTLVCFVFDVSFIHGVSEKSKFLDISTSSKNRPFCKTLFLIYSYLSDNCLFSTCLFNIYFNA